MADEKLNSTLQENLLTLLCHSDEHGKLIANILDPNLFEGEYRILAERATAFWHSNGEAPKNHTSDLVDDILDDPHNRKAKTYQRIILAMSELSTSINVGYVLEKLTTFSRMQRMKDAILKSAERLNSQQEGAIVEVEEIWNELLRTRELTFDPGMYLIDYERVLSFLENRAVEFVTGVTHLNERGFVPARGTAMLFLAPTGRGKTWFLIDIGKQALKQRKKVCHITCELSAEETMQRYYQSLFSISKREQKIVNTVLQTDEDGKLSGFSKDEIIPDFTFADNFIRDELKSHVNAFGSRFNNLIIKKFPMRSLTINKLNAYLDNLEVTEKFIPDMLILDYIGIMSTDAKNHRISLGRTFEDFRGLCDERNVAGVTAQQVSKIGADAKQVSMTQVSEDWSLTNTADQVATFSQTKAEERLGLARLYISKARSEEDKFTVLITQNYRIGQFCLDSAMMNPKYQEYLDTMEKEDEESEDDDAGESEDDE